MKKWRKRTIRAVTCLFLFLIVPLAVVYGFAQRMPEFYQKALEVDQATYRKHGEDFESIILTMQNDVLTYSKWQAVITDKQLNGWLAVHLGEKFPGTLPQAIDKPRIAFFDHNFRMAFRIDYGWFSGIVHVSGDIFCPESNNNQIAIRIATARFGLLPIPISFWADQLTDSLNQSGVATVWDEKDGDPVALVTLPNRMFTDESRKYRFTTIELSKNRMLIKGVAETVQE